MLQIGLRTSEPFPKSKTLIFFDSFFSRGVISWFFLSSTPPMFLIIWVIFQEVVIEWLIFFRTGYIGQILGFFLGLARQF